MPFRKNKLRATQPPTAGKTSFLSRHLNTRTTSKPETQIELPINDILGPHMVLGGNGVKPNK